MPHKDPEKAKTWRREWYRKRYAENPTCRRGVWKRHHRYAGECERCGQPFLGRNPTSRFCSRACSLKWLWENGEANTFLVGSTNAYVSTTHHGRKVRIHRLVVEEQMQRQLLPTEHVHHINGNKADNRPENLMVIAHNEHAGLHMKFPARRRIAEPVTKEMFA